MNQYSLMRFRAAKADDNGGNRKLMITGVTLGLLVVLTLTLTSPQRLGPVGVTFFFVALFLLSLTGVELFYRARKLTNSHLWLRVTYAVLPVFLLALSSLRQLTIPDLLLSVGLVVIITMYHNRQIAK